jgi:hypothetical protein
MSQYHRPRWGAIFFGALCATGTALILLEDGFTSGKWSSDHALAVIVLAGTIGAGHYAARAPFFPASALWLLFLLGTAYCVLSTAGRMTATQGQETRQATAINEALHAKRQDLMTARQRLTDAERMVDHETKDRYCARKCQDWQRRAIEVRAHITQLETEIRKLGPPQAVHAKAGAAAATLSMIPGITITEAQIATMLERLLPFAAGLFLELGALAFLHHGWPHRQSLPATLSAQRSVSAEPPAISAAATVSGPAYHLRKQLPAAITAALAIDAASVAAVRSALAASGRQMSNADLAAAMGVTPGEASKRTTAAIAAGAVTRTRAGRHVIIALA